MALVSLAPQEPDGARPNAPLGVNVPQQARTQPTIAKTLRPQGWGGLRPPALLSCGRGTAGPPCRPLTT